MTREAREVKPGDVFITGAVRVDSVMTEGDSTFISWRGETRQLDVVGQEEEAPDVFPCRCPECGFVIVDDGWECG